jgi:hypothetical protein
MGKTWKDRGPKHLRNAIDFNPAVDMGAIRFGAFNDDADTPGSKRFSKRRFHRLVRLDARRHIASQADS